MPFDVRLEDGTVLRNVPDGTTRAQIEARMGGRMPAAPPPKTPQDVNAMLGEALRGAPRQPKSTMRQLGDSVVNNLAGAAQGLAFLPDAATQAMAGGMRMMDTAVGVPSEALADLLGNKRGAEAMRRDRRAQDMALANPVTIGGLIEKAAPTPQDSNGQWARFGSQMLGSMMVPMGPKVTPPTKIPRRSPRPPRSSKVIPNAAEVVAAGDRNGVRVLTSDVRPPRTAMTNWLRGRLEQIPIAGTGGVRQAQQAQRVDAIKNAVASYGGRAERTLLDDAGGAVDDVAANLANTRSQEIARLTGAKRSVIEGTPGTVPVDRTITSINEQIARMEALKLPELKPAIAKLQGWREALQGQSLANVEDIRKAMGEAFKAPELGGIRSTGEKAVSAIYDPMRAEMGTFIRQRGGEEALSKWAGANERLSTMAGELKNAKFRNVLRTEELTPESVGRLLFSKNPSDVSRLMGNLSKPGQAKAREAIIQRAYDGAISADAGLSVERFVNNIKTLEPSVTGAFRGADLDHIRGLTRLLDATRQAAAAGRMPQTGAQNTPVAVFAGMLHFLGTTATVAIGGGAGILGRAYESAPVRNALIRAARVKAGSQSETILMNRAAQAMAQAMGNDIAKLANDNTQALSRQVLRPLAADPEDQSQRR